MDLMSQNQGLNTLQKTLQNNTNTQSIMHSTNSDFPVAITILAFLALALLLASYYIFVIKCCLDWQTLNPFGRVLPSRSSTQHDVDQLMSFSPMVGIHRGLDEWLINNIPAFQYKSGENNKSNSSSSRSSSNNNNKSVRRCAICLNEFKENDILRVIPKCSHNFHLDCIDVWLLKNASCPLCRSNISGRKNYVIDQINAPNSSPQEALSPLFSGSLRINVNEDSDRDFVVIDLSEDETSTPRRNVSREMSQRKTEQKGTTRNFKKTSKSQCRRSIMGDECIDIRPKNEEFSIQQPIRRSISMDSAINRGMYLQVQEIIRQSNRIVCNNNEVSCSNSRVRRSSFFSFGSRSSSIIPLDCDV